jgi:hypothetical protein
MKKTNKNIPRILGAIISFCLVVLRFFIFWCTAAKQAADNKTCCRQQRYNNEQELKAFITNDLHETGPMSNMTYD